MQLIKLTSATSGLPFYINADRVESINDAEPHHKEVYAEAKTVLGIGGQFCAVRETPDEVASMIQPT